MPDSGIPVRAPDRIVHNALPSIPIHDAALFHRAHNLLMVWRPCVRRVQHAQTTLAPAGRLCRRRRGSVLRCISARVRRGSALCARCVINFHGLCAALLLWELTHRLRGVQAAVGSIHVACRALDGVRDDAQLAQ